MVGKSGNQGELGQTMIGQARNKPKIFIDGVSKEKPNLLDIGQTRIG